MERNQKRAFDRKGLAKRVGVFLGLSLSLIALLAAMVACGDDSEEVTTGSESAGDNNPPDSPVQLSSDDYYSLSGIAISEDGAYAYASDETGCRVYKIKIEDGTLTALYESELPIHNVAVSGDKVYATAGGLGGQLLVLDANLSLQGSVVTGHTPVDVVVSGDNAYVANRFSNSVSVVDLSSMTETSEIAVTREPMAMTLAGSDLYVACHLPAGAANADYVGANVDVIDTAKGELSKSISLVNGAGNVKDIIVSPDNQTVYVSHIVARYQNPTTQLDGGWVNTNGITLIDAAAKELKYTYLLDDVDRGAANPWGLALSDNGAYLYTAIAGTGEVIRTDLGKISRLVTDVERGRGTVKKVEEIVNDISFAASIKTRIDLGGVGPRALAYHDGKVYAANYYSGDIKVLDESSLSVSATLTVGEQPEADAVRQGEIYWNDATICYQNWQSCSSCHPDARSGVFNWDELGDGIGTPKNTKSMVMSLRTPAALSTGVEPSAESNIAGSVSGTPLMNSGSMAGEISEKIIEYLKSILPEPSPYLNDDGSLSELAETGKKLFSEYNCAMCHPAPFYTDMVIRETTTIEFDPSWEDRPLDTPALVELWRSAPWTYIGQFTDMSELVKYMANQFSGKTPSDSDAAALAEYVLSIGLEGEQYGAEQVTNSDGSYNAIVPGSAITGVTVRQQVKSTSDATVTLTLYDKDGKEIGKASGTVTAEDIRFLTKITFESAVSVPESIAEGAYYTVTITDSSGENLATELKIKY